MANYDFVIYFSRLCCVTDARSTPYRARTSSACLFFCFLFMLSLTFSTRWASDIRRAATSSSDQHKQTRACNGVKEREREQECRERKQGCCNACQYDGGLHYLLVGTKHYEGEVFYMLLSACSVCALCFCSVTGGKQGFFIYSTFSVI